MLLNIAFIPSGIPLRNASRYQCLQPPRNCLHARQRWRAAATGAGQSSVPFQPDDLKQNSSKQEKKPPHASDTSNDDTEPGELDTTLLSTQDTAIAVDPVKNIPNALIDTSGAMQMDDGSFAPAAITPRRLVRRQPKTPSFDNIKTNLKSGFDSGLGATIVLFCLFGSWYWSNTAFNVYNKQVLRVFPYPLTCTVVQFAVASAIMCSTWLLRLKKPPKVNPFLFRTAVPLGFLHAAGFVFTNMSLGKVSVAFTHTVKATEPFFSAALTPSILGDVPTWGIIGSLFPIVAGVAIASATDVSFNWIGFLSAMGSNLALQSRNVLSKRLMDSGSGKKVKVRKMRPITEEEEDTLTSLDNINLFSTMTIFAFFILAPLCIAVEGFPLLTAAVNASVTGIPKFRLIYLLVIGGAYRCVDVLASYMILKRVSPVSHSIGNCVKRAIVISSSVFFFNTQMTALNVIGTSLALFGVLAYSLIISACKQNTFGPDSPFCRPIYSEEVELTEGGGI